MPCGAAGQEPEGCVRKLSERPSAWFDKCNKIGVLDAEMSYYDSSKFSKPKIGPEQAAVVFLHGNPTSSFLWRNIIPHVEGLTRCLAPDLIGMGRSSKQKNNSYRFSDHYRYLSAWLESVDLPEKVAIVCHDWGSGLGFHWSHQNPSRVKGIVHMESIVAVVPSWEAFPEIAQNIFQAMRSEAGEEMVLENNFFVERLLPTSVIRELSSEEMTCYREPFLNKGEDRRPTLTWPREIPVATEGPQDVVDIVNAYQTWLSKSADIPKLYINAEPGFFSSGIRKVTENWPNHETLSVKGLHFIQEDSPDDIGKAVHHFLKKLYL
ncbi:coelenterazine h 2-monooxygenase-like [Anneissia japonica]|uniref:coelenterazine h 2-monooxygenase-like n=1 Tax=Anneissia japonica TaxID=1529436 RepID=UPI001425588F|nr:coelenterazine h 2-monooxygenase-like [Anneissia japonica]